MELKKESEKKYLPSELHFPWVALDLQWLDLPVIDWPDLNRRSLEWNFLKELGVREVPLLERLIDRIETEHRKQEKTPLKDYQIPLALRFFAEHFSEHYSKQWKSNPLKKPFLPSLIPQLRPNQTGDEEQQQQQQVTLLTPPNVFKGLFSSPATREIISFSSDGGPLCPSLLPEVVRCFSPFVDLKHLGVENRPSISVAFQLLLKHRDVLLTRRSAPRLFAYLNQLDGLNQKFIQQLSTLSFIPHPSKFFASLLSLALEQ